MGLDEIDQAVLDEQQPLRQGHAGGRLQAAVVDGPQPAPGPFDQAIAGHGGPGVDAQDDQAVAASAKTSSGISKFAVTRWTSS
jgi:hypothetical protein